MTDKSISFTLNGQPQTVTTDPARSLLEVLREDLGLTGTKYGCGEGRCGACTVLINGFAAHACVLRVGKVAEWTIQTIEGLATGNELHPVQQAFLDEGALQCGYCTPGMIMGVVALLNENANPSDAEILEGMESHLCRCGSYPRILQAIRRAAGRGGPQS